MFQLRWWRRVLLGMAIVVTGVAVVSFAVRQSGDERSRDPWSEVAWGVPSGSLTVVSLNTCSGRHGPEEVIALLRSMEADVVLLQEVQDQHVAEIAQQLAMDWRYVPQLPGPHQDVFAGESRGSVVLSKLPMGPAVPLRHEGGGNFGLRVDVRAGDVRFAVACVHLSATHKLDPQHVRDSYAARYREFAHLLNEWRERGRPPLIVGGDFNQLPAGDNYRLMTEELTDVLAAKEQTEATFHGGPRGLIRTRIDYLLTSPSWLADDAQVIWTDASDHNLIRATLGGK